MFSRLLEVKKSKSLYIIMSFLMLLGMWSCIDYYMDYAQWGEHSMIFPASQVWILSTPDSLQSFFFLPLMLLGSILPYGFTLQRDFKIGLAQLQIARMGKARYLFQVLATNSLVSALVTLVPLLFSLYIVSLFFRGIDSIKLLVIWVFS